MRQDAEVVPLTAAHLDAVAGLLAQRQATLRAIRPELPAAFAEADGCRPLLEAVLARDGAYGVVAWEAGTVTAFMLGYPRYEPIWGRACWSPIEGQAYDPAIGPEVMRDL